VGLTGRRVEPAPPRAEWVISFEKRVLFDPPAMQGTSGQGGLGIVRNNRLLSKYFKNRTKIPFKF
ncbi:MAG: hypothetical protein OEM90_19840, partial [Desulfobacteraceae bacterium]|nr:hypothetical protein [Desulfobacteraceae bacterium]